MKSSIDLIKHTEEHTSGAKAPDNFAAFTARLKSCPDASCISTEVSATLAFLSYPFKAMLLGVDDVRK
jgi:hypothetical protein